MDEKELVTVVFTNVPDMDIIKEAVSDAIHFPIVYTKEQNNGVVAFVLQGILPDVAQPMFKQIVDSEGLTDVEVVAHEGNIFK